MKIKSLLLTVSVLGLSLGIVLISAIRVSRSQVRAQTGLGVEMESTSGGEKVEVEKVEVIEEGGEVDYYLAYPGILPDHPLYWLKMIRDRVLLLLTRDPVARLDRLLLYADKRVGAAKALIEGGKAQLGVTTATKGEKYLEQTVAQFEKVKAVGKVTPELEDKLTKAILKHEEVLTQVLNKVPDQAKPAIVQAMEKSRHGYERVMEVMGRKKEEGIKKEESREKKVATPPGQMEER